MRRPHVSPIRSGSLLLSIFLAAGLVACGGGEPGRPIPLEAVTLYAEPDDSTDPLLIFPRDLLRLGDRVFVLDGRLAHVAVLDATDGRPLDRFGGMGEGPGELGMFPFALVTDGIRIGVAHEFQVSWFTLDGLFLERERIPAVDLSTPALHRDGDGWLYNASYAGPGSPVVLYVPAEGDSVAFGSAAVPEGTEAGPLALMERNAALPVRLGDGRLRRNDSWTHLDPEPERRSDGRVRGMPGFALAASPTPEGGAVVLDGTARLIRHYGADGRLRFTYQLSEPVLRVIWSEDRGWALDVRGHLVLLRPGPEEPDEGSDGLAEAPGWLGIDILAAAGPLVDLTGAPLNPGTPERRLWVVVSDLECLACLEEIPRIADLVEEKGMGTTQGAVLALGDVFEARRTLWGVDTAGMLVAVSANRDLSASWGGQTPMRLLAWHGRLVEGSLERVDQPGGRESLLRMLDRWGPDQPTGDPPA